MNVMVTGAAGFLGSALVDRLLAAGHHVDAVDNLSTGSLSTLSDARGVGGGAFSFHQLDVRSSEVANLIGRRPPEVIWHLAGRTSVAAGVDNPALDAEVNVVGTLKVLEAAKAAGVRKVVVVSSGSAVYGAADRLPSRESDPRQPCSPLGVSMHAVDSYLVTFRELHGLEFTSLVLASVYGPGDRAGLGVVATWTRGIAAGDPCVVYGEGVQTRDFVYVDDAVDALARAADAGDGLVLNVGTGIETSLTELHRLLVSVASAVGIDPAGALLLASSARPGEVAHSALDATRARIHLDWQPWTALKDGLASVMSAMVADEPDRPPD